MSSTAFRGAYLKGDGKALARLEKSPAAALGKDGTLEMKKGR